MGKKQQQIEADSPVNDLLPESVEDGGEEVLPVVPEATDPVESIEAEQNLESDSEPIEPTEADQPEPTPEPQYLSFAEVMRIHNQHKAEGLIPADPQPERKKRPKTKRF